jgi:uncharacterized repeat protein (TIGR01451 family)
MLSLFFHHATRASNFFIVSIVILWLDPIVTANAAPIVSVPNPPIPRRILINPSFENPPAPAKASTNYEAYIPGAGLQTAGRMPIMQGWYSTHPAKNGAVHLMEVWTPPFGGMNQSAAGRQHIELNAGAPSAVYQDFCLLPGERPRWSVAHRGRANNNITDIAEILLSNPADWSTPIFTGNKLYAVKVATASDGSPAGFVPNSIVNPTQTETVSAPFNGGWVKYSGQMPPIPTMTWYRFALQSVSTATGNLSVGNFIDDLRFELAPTIEFVETNDVNLINRSNYREDKADFYYLTLRLNGEMWSAGSIDLTLDASSTASPEDYYIVALNNGLNTTTRSGITATKLPNGTIRLTIPPGVYDVNNPADYITVGLNFFDQTPEPTETIGFTLSNPQGGGTDGLELRLGNGSCAAAKANQTTSIVDADLGKRANLLLVKRITRINHQTQTNSGDNLAIYHDLANDPYDDNVITIPHDSTQPGSPRKDTNQWPDPNHFLVGGINGGKVQTHDQIEYTIYFLSAGDYPAEDIYVCDRIPESTTFVPTTFNPLFNSSPQRGILVTVGNTSQAMTNLIDSDIAQYIPVGVDPHTISPKVNCGGANTNGAIVVHLPRLPQASTALPSNAAYGFIRFIGLVK